jgi:hypothetical protein
MRVWIAKRRTDWMAGKVCVKCSSTHRLEVDHIDRATKVDHRIWSWSIARRDAELVKCQVLCFDCHVAKTVVENVALAGGWEHSNAAYKAKRCKCDTCKAAHAEYNRRWREARA